MFKRANNNPEQYLCLRRGWWEIKGGLNRIVKGLKKQLLAGLKYEANKLGRHVAKLLGG